jgi:hypothetical protein
MQVTPILSPGDFSRRQVLPLSAAIRPVRFARRDWEVSAQVRDVLDSFDHSPLRPAPRPVVDHPCESIVMEGASIQRTMRTGGHVVRQNSTVTLELDDTPAPPLAFETTATPMQSAASEALAAMDRPHARRGARLPRPALKAPRTASGLAMTIAAVLAGLVIAALVVVVRNSLR